MKKILFAILVLIGINAFGQNPPGYQSRNVRERIQGSFMVDSTNHIPRYCGTPSGVRGGGSIQDGAIAIDTCNHVFFFYSDGKWRNAGSLNTDTKLIHGGIVTWDSLLVFNVSAATYYINGAFYSSAITNVTLDAAHATLNRIDLIYLDSSGVHKLSGDAAATPAEPNLPVNSIRLTAIQVPSLATTPGGGIDTLVIYDQNVEWVGSTTSVTVDFDNFTSPYHFTKAASVGAITSASLIKFTSTSDYTTSDYKVLRFYIKLKAAFAQNVKLGILFANNGSYVSQPFLITHLTYGFDRTSGNYQQITIPLSDITFTANTFDQIIFGSNGSNSSGYYLDWVQLQTGISQTTSQANRFAVVGEDFVASQNRYFNGKNQFYFDFDSIASFVVKGTNTQLKNIAGSNWLSHIPSTTGITIDPLSTSIPLNINNLTYNSGAEVVNLAQDTLTGRVYRKSGGGGAGTINSGTTGKPAYYVGSTTLDDFSPVDYATSGTNVLITAAATTDIPLNIKAQGSQSANLLNVSSSGGTGDIFNIQASSSGIVGIGTTSPATYLPGGNGLAISGTGNVGVSLKNGSDYFLAYNSGTNYQVYSSAQGGNVMTLTNTGSMAIGTITPTARLHLPGGTATANTAPLKINSGTLLSTTEAGAIENDGTHLYVSFANSGTRYQLDQQSTKSKGMTLETPGAAESFGMWQTQVAITVSSIKAVVLGSGSPSVTINIAFGTDRTSGTNVFSSGTAITNTTTGQTLNSGFNDATIPAGSFIWFISTAQSGTVTQIEVTINYTED